MKKKLTSIVFIFVLCVLVLCAFVGCRKKHSHDYGEWMVTIEPTCETKGERIRSCSGCSIKKTETIPALGHTYGEWINEVSATCTEDGVKAHFECSICHKNFDENHEELNDLVIVHGHTYGEWINEVSATCTEDGTKGHFECTDCHEYFTADKQPLTDLTIKGGHNFGEWIDEIKATCTKDGVKAHFECSVCHKYFDTDKNEIKDVTIESLDHNFGEWIDEIKPTCTEDGVKAHYECSVCHKNFDIDKSVIEDLNISRFGHTYSEWNDKIEATCFSEGTKGHYECSVCHKYFDIDKNVIEDWTIAKIEHTYGDWHDEIEATCFSEGTKGYYECSVCHKYFDIDKNEIEGLTIPVTHNKVFIEGVKATCTQSGIADAYRCTICRQTFDTEGNVITTIPTITAFGHNYGEWIDEVPATDNATGTKAHKDCLTCGLHFDADEKEIESLTIPALQHVFSEWIDEVSATCTEDGKKGHYECDHCSLVFDKDYNVIEDVTIPASHNLVHHERKEPTCESTGEIEHNYCTKCHNEFDSNMEMLSNSIIWSLGHDYGDWIDEVPATCTVNGVKGHKTCTRCNENFDENNNKIANLVIMASHTLGNRTKEIPATCTSDGRIAYDYCSVCEKTFDVFGSEKSASELIIPAKGHDYGDWIKEFSATCTETGVIGHYHCNRCNKDFDADNHEIAGTTIPAHGHIYTTETIIPQLDPTCDEDGYIAHFECGECGVKFNENGYVIESLTLSKTGHSYYDFEYKVEPTCTQPGRKEYYVCSKCSKFFNDSDNYTTLTEADLVLPALGHKYDHVDQIEATCFGYGTKEHYHCDRCNTFFNTEKTEVAFDTITIKKVDHVYGGLISGIAATETENGRIAHYECKVCGHCVDENYKEVTTIVLPKLEHSFDYWHEKKDEGCDYSGTMGYYFCSNCGKCFDKDYNEIENVGIAPHHVLGELIEAKQGICDEPDILVSYYECSRCGQKVDEQNNVLYDYDIFEYNDRHNWEYSKFDEWDHKKVCKDCGKSYVVLHEVDKIYYVENGLHMYKYVCKYCGNVSDNYSYDAIVETRVISDYYVGYTNDYSSILEVKYEDGRYFNWSLSSLADYTVLNELHDMLSSLPENFTPFVKSFHFEENDYEETVTITFRPLVINAVKTKFDYYQSGGISDISDIEFILDCNYTDNLGEIISVNGYVTDHGDFDPYYDFETTGETSKVFTIKYEYEGKTYDVNITLCTDIRPKEIQIDTDEIMQGDSLKFNIIYTDNSLQEFVLIDADIVEGMFDSSVLGKQTFTICKDGLVKKVSVYVLDPYGVRNYYVSKSNIFIGESITLDVTCNNDSYRLVTVTPEMIIGDFDNMTPGSYSITISLNGMRMDTEITVKDPNDYRIESIFVTNGSSVVWEIVDGAVVPNYYNLYLTVFKYNETSETISITEDMVSYKQSDVDNAIAKESYFEAVVTYYGKTTILTVYPRDLQTYSARNFYITKSGPNTYASYSTIYAKNGDLSDYAIKFTYGNDYRYRYVPLTKDMFFIDQDGTTLFDFDAMENKKAYTAYVHCGAMNEKVTLKPYGENDVRYYVTNNSSITATVGTRESVLDSLKDYRFSLWWEIDFNSNWVCYFGIGDVSLDESENIDFSKPGYIELKAFYNDVEFTIYIRLIESLEGVEKTTYTYEGEDFDFYANGFVYVEYYNEWGTIVCINQELGLYRALIDYQQPMVFKIEGNIVSKFYAEMLGGIEEIYTFETINGIVTYKVYTKNAFSLADMYDKYDDLNSTCVVEFSLDGKYIYIDYVRYTIKADNKLELEEEGNIVYTYYFQEGTNAARLHYNDNGIVYMYFTTLDSNGNVLQEVLSETLTWTESNGNVYAYEDADLILKGKVVGGELVIDTNF